MLCLRRSEQFLDTNAWAWRCHATTSQRKQTEDFLTMTWWRQISGPAKFSARPSAPALHHPIHPPAYKEASKRQHRLAISWFFETLAMAAAASPASAAAVTALILSASALILTSTCGFTLPTSSSSTLAAPRNRHRNLVLAPHFAEGTSNSNDVGGGGKTLFFASEVTEETTEEKKQQKAPPTSSAAISTATASATANGAAPTVTLFDKSTLQEANDALSSVGWSGVAPMQGEGEMTSDDPFVKQIDESIMKEMGVGLDQLLNPAKVRACYLVVSREKTLYVRR